MPSYSLSPIGWVRSGITVPADDCWGGTTAVIELDGTRFGAESLRGLDAFSHVDVVFLFHKIDAAGVLTGASHPRQRADWPEVGIFAQRSKNRPNRLGVTTCAIVKVEGPRLTVAELDAIDGTPVIDLKPHIRGFGPRTAQHEPEWAGELMKQYFGSGFKVQGSGF